MTMIPHSSRLLSAAALWGATALVLALPGGAPCPAAAAPEAKRDVTFLATSDCHYDAFENEDRNERDRATIDYMNGIATVEWPRNIGGGPIARPRGVVVLGDLLDDGDRKLDGKLQSDRQYASFIADFGLDGTDGRLKYPVFETWGNHDGPPEGREKNGFSFQAQLKKRNDARMGRGWLTGLSTNKLHYSWDWDDVHFVMLGIYPADAQRAGLRYNAEWHNPQGALSFLKADLAKCVGNSGRPVVLMSHCGFDTGWWSQEDWKDLYDAAKGYNVILYLYGHSGTGVADWAPPGEAKRWNTLNTGQTENGMFVVQITGDTLRMAYRLKDWNMEKQPDGKSKRVWTGNWMWKFTKKTALGAGTASAPTE